MNFKRYRLDSCRIDGRREWQTLHECHDGSMMMFSDHAAAMAEKDADTRHMADMAEALTKENAALRERLEKAIERLNPLLKMCLNCRFHDECNELLGGTMDAMGLCEEWEAGK